MVKFKIHFTHKNGMDDEFIVEGESVEDAREEMRAFFEKRGLDYSELNAWSEEL